MLVDGIREWLAGFCLVGAAVSTAAWVVVAHGRRIAASMDGNGNTVPSMVSWSYGPLLRDGGEIVTCSIGALYIHGHARPEVSDEE